MTEVYFEHFGLTQAPFKITPDTRLFYTGGRAMLVIGTGFDF